MSKKNYPYFCAYIIGGDKKLYSSEVHEFPQQIDSHAAVRAAERQIAGEFKGIDPKTLRLTCLTDISGTKATKNDAPYAYFVAYAAEIGGHNVIGNTVLDLEYQIQCQADITAVEEILRDKNAGKKVGKLRLLNFSLVGN